MMEDAIDIYNLLESIQRGDTFAFNMFYEMYYDQVFRYAYYFLKRTEDCREVVADVFYTMWQSRRRLVYVENLDAYLLISVRNEVTRYKKHRNVSVSLDDLAVSLEIMATEESPHDEVSYKEMERLLGEIIGKLPEKCRLVFMMARQEGLKPKEIAERLCISENTVRVQMKIAIEKIVKQVKLYYPDLTLALLYILLKVKEY